ncbi:NAD-P-binding protein [Trametes cingulata]|nr:NAD-P-binding protein [Trametes cingulata]
MQPCSSVVAAEYNLLFERQPELLLSIHDVSTATPVDCGRHWERDWSVYVVHVPELRFMLIGLTIGTGAATACVYTYPQAGYRIALIARNVDHLQKVVEQIKSNGGEAAAFPVSEYSYSAVARVFDDILAHPWPSAGQTELRVALWNVGVNVFGNFLSVTEADIEASMQVHVTAGFAFSRRVILAFRENTVDELGCRGTLIFTGATASIRGNVFTSAFSAGKFGIRALSQSLAKEFGQENIHSIIDGSILTDLSLTRRPGAAGEAWKANPDVRLEAESVAKSYLYLTQQDRSAWTWELDLRPAHEKW